MEEKKKILTYAGLKALEDELVNLKVVKRKEVAAKITEVVVEDEVDSDKINIGCTVAVYDEEFDEEIEFKIVGSTEANSLQGKISNESPVGKALLGREVGDEVVVETQAGDITYKVLKIERSI